MHITSLPSVGGIGDLGPEAYHFADFLKKSGIKIWQVLPVCPTGYGESPYQSPSAFAGNPLMISPEKLRSEKLLSYEDQELNISARTDRVDFEAVRKLKMQLLQRAWQQSGEKLSRELSAFRKEQAWVDDFALFMAIKEHSGSVMWSKWPDAAARRRDPAALDQYRKDLKDEIGFHVFCQYLFRRQWAALRKYCNDLGISIMGDMPIYVAEDSSDTWTHPEVFQLDSSFIPTRVAGVPPDYFSADGQRWGNPLYRWFYLWLHRYDWWVDRMKSMTSLYDLVRIDHFIGFANYFSVDYNAPTARDGKWIIGPGKHLFKRLNKEIPGMNIIAEDLGAVNDRVRRLLKWTGYPGMKILQYGFDGDPEQNEHEPRHYTENYVLYTGTHDNDTTLSWARHTDPETLKKAEKEVGFSGAEEAPEAFVRYVYASPCDRAVVPMQDILGLDGDARMNTPGTLGGGNWGWRMVPGSLTDGLSARLKKLMQDSNR